MTESVRDKADGATGDALTDSILKVAWLGHLSNITRSVRKHEATQRNRRELE